MRLTIQVPALMKINCVSTNESDIDDHSKGSEQFISFFAGGGNFFALKPILAIVLVSHDPFDFATLLPPKSLSIFFSLSIVNCNLLIPHHQHINHYHN